MNKLLTQIIDITNSDHIDDADKAYIIREVILAYDSGKSTNELDPNETWYDQKAVDEIARLAHDKGYAEARKDYTDVNRNPDATIGMRWTEKEMQRMSERSHNEGHRVGYQEGYNKCKVAYDTVYKKQSPVELQKEYERGVNQGYVKGTEDAISKLSHVHAEQLDIYYNRGLKDGHEKGLQSAAKAVDALFFEGVE